VVRATGPDLGRFRQRSVARLRAAHSRGRKQALVGRGWTWGRGPMPEPTPHW
jgi:hypothetical protein